MSTIVGFTTAQRAEIERIARSVRDERTGITPNTPYSSITFDPSGRAIAGGAGGGARGGFGARRSSNQTINNSTATRFDPSATVDPNSMITTGSSWHATLGAADGGFWVVTANLSFILSSAATWPNTDSLACTLTAGGYSTVHNFVGHDYAQVPASFYPVVGMTLILPMVDLYTSDQIHVSITQTNGATGSITVTGWLGAWKTADWFGSYA